MYNILFSSHNPTTAIFFFHCSNGVAYCKECPADLHWNDKEQTCDYPYRAGCNAEVSTVNHQMNEDNSRHCHFSQKIRLLTALLAHFPNAATPMKDILFSSHIRATPFGSFTVVAVQPIARNVLQFCIGTTN